MPTNQPIDPDTGQPIEPSTDEAPPENVDDRDDVDVAQARSDDDLIMDEVLIEDDPGSSTDR